MEFLIKKTVDLTDKDWQDLQKCFVEVYEKDRTLVEMKNQYMNTPMGGCIHSLCYDNDTIVAAHTAFPSYYWVGEKKMKVFITGDTMVKKGYRDGSAYIDLILGLNKYMKQDGYVFSFGFPKENAYYVDKKGRIAKNIGRLTIYVLPYRIGGIKKSLAWLNPLSKSFCYLWVAFGGLFSRSVPVQALIHKDDETYNMSRYKRMDADYNHVLVNGAEFYYKVKEQEGIRTAFLIDVIGKTEHSFYIAVKYIIEKEKKNIDLLMYVGHLPNGVKYIGMLSVPRKVEPKHFYVTGKIIDKSQVTDDLIFDIRNWDVNLSDYDVI